MKEKGAFILWDDMIALVQKLKERYLIGMVTDEKLYNDTNFRKRNDFMHIETARLTIRPLECEDFDSFHDYVMDKELSRMYGLPIEKNKEITYKIFKSFLNNGKISALVYKDNSKVIGHVMVVMPELPNEELEKLGEKKGVTIAFAVAKEYQRQGLMQEALRSVTEELFTVQKLDYIHCGYYDFNLPSRKLQEKLGFQYFSGHNLKNLLTLYKV